MQPDMTLTALLSHHHTEKEIQQLLSLSLLCLKANGGYFQELPSSDSIHREQSTMETGEQHCDTVMNAHGQHWHLAM